VPCFVSARTIIAYFRKKASFEKVFIHLKINKIHNVSLARRKDLFDKKSLLTD